MSNGLRQVFLCCTAILYEFVSSNVTPLFLQPVELWSKHGRRGRIKETVGTHGMFSDPADVVDQVVFFCALLTLSLSSGSMKCIFNTSVQQHDTVCMSLFKRAFPKWPEQLYQIGRAHV